MTASHLRAVADDEADILGRRAHALELFDAHYRRKQPSTHRAMRGALERLVKDANRGRETVHTVASFPWELLDNEDWAEALWSASAVRHAHRTGLRDASALRVLLHCLHKAGLLSYEQFRRAASFETRRVGKTLPPAGRYLSEADVQKIVDACLVGGSSQGTNFRDRALILTLASSGCRALEAANVRLEDYFPGRPSVYLTTTKSGEPREAWLHPAAVQAVDAWLTIRGRDPGYLFTPLRRNGSPDTLTAPLSHLQIWKIVKRRSALAGLNGNPGVAPHDLRRFAISALLQSNDLALVARIVGHRSPVTTATYDRRPIEQAKAAVASLSLSL